MVKGFLLCHQDSYCRSSIVLSHQNQTQNLHVPPSQHLLFILLKDDFIPYIADNSIILFLPVKFLYWYGIVPTVLSRYTFNILKTKFSQDLAFIWWMPGDMYEIGEFGLTLCLVYKYFSALASAFTHLGVIIIRGILSSL